MFDLKQHDAQFKKRGNQLYKTQLSCKLFTARVKTFFAEFSA